MDRRTFIKGLGATSLSLPYLLRSRRAWATTTSAPDDTLVVVLHADGGWDPAMLCDPKGYTDYDDRITNFHADDTLEIGNFQVAPITAVEDFFTDYQDDLLVLNGVDNQTNNHVVGVRHQWSGVMSHGFPSIAALAAAGDPDHKSTALLSFGGYDYPAGLLPITRLPSAALVQDLAHPFRRTATNPDSRLISSSIEDTLRAAQLDRLDRQIAAAGLPRPKRAMELLRSAREGDNELAALSPYLPSEIADTPLKRQIQIAIAAFEAGTSTSASLFVEGFDTHDDHDTRHTAALTNLFEGASYLMQLAEEKGLADRILLLMGSDFGRTPWYNEHDGKDHYSITSMIMMGPGIDGGRVIGSTDDTLTPDLLDETTLEPDVNGIRITPAHIHQTLREHLGLDTQDVEDQWPMSEASLSLFSA